MINDSFDVPAPDQFERDGAPPGQARFDADSETGRAHGFDQSNPLHPDWLDSSGIALPTVDELHYAHHFLIRAAERRLKEVFPASVRRPRSPQCISPPVVASESELFGTSPRNCPGTG